MSRFFKSAAFPILIVIVLAFFASRLISSSDRAEPKTFGQFLTQIEQKNQVKSVTLDTKDNSVEVVLPDDKKYEVGFPDAYGDVLVNQLKASRGGRQHPVVRRQAGAVQRDPVAADVRAAVPDLHRVLDLPHEPGPRRRLEGDVVRQVARQADVGRLAEDHLPRRGGRRRGGRGAARDQGVPREPQEVPGARRADPEGRAALRPSGHRQDAAGPRRRRRGGRAVLLDLRLGLRRDVRRRRRLARARPVRAGQAELALHHLHGRDRRRRPPPRRRPRRRSRRARADAESAARRDGRLRGQGQHHHDRGHQPARHPRSRPAPSRPLRPPDHRRPARPRRPPQDPRGPHARQAAREGHRARRAGRPDARLHRRRPGQPGQRGRPPRRPHGQEGDHPGRARRGHHAGGRRPGEEDPGHGREGAADHGLPRDGPRDRRPLPRALRPGPQDLDHLPRPGAGLHDLPARPRTSSSPRARS